MSSRNACRLRSSGAASPLPARQSPGSTSRRSAPAASFSTSYTSTSFDRPCRRQRAAPPGSREKPAVNPSGTQFDAR